MKKFLLLISIFIFSFPIASFAAPQFSLGYWNDVMDYESALNGGNWRALDDYMTASFHLSYVFDTWNRRWQEDTYLHIITNRLAGYRTDLLSSGMSVLWDMDTGKFKTGAGIMAIGDFGGKEIQNNYHKTRGILAVNLPYADNKSGLYYYISYRQKDISWKFLRGGLFLSNLHCSEVGLKNLRTGLEIKTKKFTVFPFLSPELSAAVNYSYYYGLGNELEPVFQSGIVYGGMLSARMWNWFGISVWTVSNLYRLDQGHSGIAFTFGGEKTTGYDFESATFP